MIKTARVGGMVAVLTGLILPVPVGAGETNQQAVPLILNLVNRPVESRERAFSEDVKREALAPRPSGLDDWEPQPDGSMRNRKTGISIIVRNPCPPGDMEHEFALAAYNRAKNRR